MHRGPGGGSYPQCCKESDMTEMIQQACTMHSNLSQKKKKKRKKEKDFNTTWREPQIIR